MIELKHIVGEYVPVWICDRCKCAIAPSSLVLLGIQFETEVVATFTVHKTCAEPFKLGHYSADHWVQYEWGQHAPANLL